jgi:hypothetical protein
MGMSTGMVTFKNIRHAVRHIYFVWYALSLSGEISFLPRR